MQWFGQTGPEPTPNTDERLLALERELQELRLKLQERDQAISRLQQELEWQRSGASARLDQAVQAQLEQLLTDAAGPVTQLATQAYLLEVESKPVQARDILVVAKRLVHLLEDHGLTLAGQVGQTAGFDPNQHEPLQSEVSLRVGQPVVIRFAGVTYRGKLLRKAGVTSNAGAISN
jgi:molecular chaperone GrpE (heat shock protein)